MQYLGLHFALLCDDLISDICFEFKLFRLACEFNLSRLSM